MQSAILVQPIEQLAWTDDHVHQLHGAKAARLARMAQMGLPVPPTIALSVPRSMWRHELVPSLAARILTCFDSQHSHGSLCIRSSTSSEDQGLSSEAGQWFSWFSIPRQSARLSIALSDYLDALETLLQARHSQTPALSCLVQAEIACQASGVCFSQHPDAAYGLHSLVQYTDGHGSHFTDGRVTASTMLISHWSARPIVHRRQTRYTLSDGLARRLQELARQLQQDFGGPQDIEFGLADEQLWLFQTRPVTASLAGGDAHLWTRSAADEFWSGTVSDLMWRTVGDCIENLMLRRPLAALPDEHLWQQPLLKAYKGYVYLNVEPVRRVLDDLPGWARVEALQAMVGRASDWQLSPMAPRSFWLIVVAFLRAGFRWLPWMPFQDLAHSTREGHRLFSATLRRPESTSPESIMTALEDHLSHAVWGMVWAYVLVQLADRIVRKLTADSEDAVSLAFGRNPDDPVFQLDNAMRAAAAARRRNSVDSVAGLLDRYGHLAFGRDITQPRWHERPESVAHMVDACDDRLLPPRSGRAALRLLARLAYTRRGLRSAFMVWVMAPLILAGRRYVAWREAMRFGSDYYLAALRLTLRPVRGPDAEDVDPAPWLRGDEPITQATPNAAPPDSAETYFGTALYRGDVEGVVHVVRTPDDTQSMPPGAILVSEYLDPSLGPLLSHVRGAIFEFGGVLSHGGILCREHRIPSLCGVRRAARRLRTGQRVRLNATDGRIEVLA